MATDVQMKQMKDFIQRYVQDALPGEGLLEKAYIFFTREKPPENIDFPGSWYPEQLEEITPFNYYEWQVLDQLEADVLDIHEGYRDLIGVVMLYWLGELRDKLPWDEKTRWNFPRPKYRVELSGNRSVKATVEVQAWDEEEAKYKALHDSEILWANKEEAVTGILVDHIERLNNQSEAAHSSNPGL